MRKRYYIMLVARGADGELLKVPIPLHYMYTFLVGAVIGMLTITGMAGSYGRMLLKTSRFNELRTEKEALKKNYRQLEEVAQDKELQVASLAPLASEVSTRARASFILALRRAFLLEARVVSSFSAR